MTCRNTLIAARLAALLAVSALAAVGPAQAAGPQLKTQAPGWYRIMVGDIEVTALNDGTVGMPTARMLTNTTADATEKALARAYLKDPVEASVNGYLVNTGAKLVLIDTGAAAFFGPRLGKLMANLKASGYAPEQVDEVYVSHMHLDHVGGLSVGGAMAFPNAIVRVDRREGEYWLSAAQRDAAPAEEHSSFHDAMASLGPYVKADRYKPFDGDTELVPGVRAQVTRGHTPGHAFYVVESKGEKLVLWGDAMHVGAVQFASPAVTFVFDVDPQGAAVARAKAFADAAAQGHWVGAPHLSFPGLGKLRAAEGGAYVFVPANYRAVP